MKRKHKNKIYDKRCWKIDNTGLSNCIIHVPNIL